MNLEEMYAKLSMTEEEENGILGGEDNVEKEQQRFVLVGENYTKYREFCGGGCKSGSDKHEWTMEAVYRECAVVYANPGKEIERAYGTWLRAPSSHSGGVAERFTERDGIVTEFQGTEKAITMKHRILGDQESKQNAAFGDVMDESGKSVDSGIIIIETKRKRIDEEDITKNQEENNMMEISNINESKNGPEAGDFNDLMYGDEKRGGREHPTRLLLGFTTTVNNCGLRDLGYVGEKFTWERSRGKSNWIQERLDQGLANQSWQSLFPLAEVHVIEKCMNMVRNGWDLAGDMDIMGKIRVCAEKLQQWGGGLSKEYKKQHSKKFWLQEGDKNMRFFHRYASSRRKNNRVDMIKNADGVSSMAYEELLTDITSAEVKGVVFSMHPDKAAGIDGFNPAFYQAFWSVVESDVVKFCRDFMCTGTLSAGVNKALVCLIPKVKTPQTMGDLRPISLSKYYVDGEFLNANLGTNPSYTWRSIMAVKDYMQQGSRRKIVDDKDTRVWNIPWLSCPVNGYITTGMHHEGTNITVQGLMETWQRRWDNDILVDLFDERDRLLIQQIPLSNRYTGQDGWYWMWEENGKFTVKSCYRQIQGEQMCYDRRFWKLLWGIKFPGLQRMVPVVEGSTVLQILKQAFQGSTKEQCAQIGLLCWSLWIRRNTWDWRKAHEKGNECQSRGQMQQWCKPPPGWIKINIDASCRVDYDFIGAGCVVRNEKGEFMHSRACQIGGRMQAKESEVRSLKEALLWVRQWRTTKCIFKMDAKSVVDAIHGGSGDSIFHTIVEDCVEHLKHFEQVLVMFARRSANRVAHLLAQTTYSMSGPMEWDDTAPDFICNLIEEES
ncbi:hypothetical protein AgCh_033450 [Apium graveolens]